MKPKFPQKLFALVIATGFFTTGFAQTTTPLDDYMLQEMKLLELPGVVVAIVKDNKLALAKGYGYADIDRDIPYTPNTIQEIASISKPVTATAAMQLWEHGSFQLDDPIDSYLPFTVRNPNFPAVPITFRMLMNHTSSIIGNEMGFGINPPGASMPLGIFLQNLLTPGGSLYNAKKNYEEFAPGTQYQYSNVAYALLGYLVERISGMPFNEYCNQNIFRPLCMSNTRWYYSDLDTNIVARPYQHNSFHGDGDLYEVPDYPASQLKTSVVDLSRFMLMHGNYGTLDGVRIIDSTTEVMMRHKEILVTDNSIVRGYQGLGWELGHDFAINKDFFGKDGIDLGVRTATYFNITDKTAEMVFTNIREIDIMPIVIVLDQIVKDTLSTTGKAYLNCSYHFNPCEQNADYWKNRQPAWAINSVPMKLGLNHYYNANELIALLNRPDNADASTVLVKALITAKFNIAQGSELQPIVQTVNSAMNLIGSHWVPYNNPVSFSSATGVQMLNLAATLNSYNAGNLNTTSCSGSSIAIAQTNLEKQAGTKTANSFSVFPNPTSSSVTISFSLSKQENLSLKVFDMNGRLIKSVITDAEFSAGAHQLKWDAANLNAGVYVLRMKAGNYVEMRKLVVAK